MGRVSYIFLVDLASKSDIEATVLKMRFIILSWGYIALNEVT